MSETGLGFNEHEEHNTADSALTSEKNQAASLEEIVSKKGNGWFGDLTGNVVNYVKRYVPLGLVIGATFAISTISCSNPSGRPPGHPLNSGVSSYPIEVIPAAPTGASNATVLPDVPPIIVAPLTGSVNAIVLPDVPPIIVAPLTGSVNAIVLPDVPPIIVAPPTGSVNTTDLAELTRLTAIDDEGNKYSCIVPDTSVLNEEGFQNFITQAQLAQRVFDVADVDGANPHSEDLQRYSLFDDGRKAMNANQSFLDAARNTDDTPCNFDSTSLNTLNEFNERFLVIGFTPPGSDKSLQSIVINDTLDVVFNGVRLRELARQVFDILPLVDMDYVEQQEALEQLLTVKECLVASDSINLALGATIYGRLDLQHSLNGYKGSGVELQNGKEVRIFDGTPALAHINFGYFHPSLAKLPNGQVYTVGTPTVDLFASEYLAIANQNDENGNNLLDFTSFNTYESGTTNARDLLQRVIDTNLTVERHINAINKVVPDACKISPQPTSPAYEQFISLLDKPRETNSGN